MIRIVWLKRTKHLLTSGYNLHRKLYLRNHSYRVVFLFLNEVIYSIKTMLRILFLLLLLFDTELYSNAQFGSKCECNNDVDGDGINDCFDKCPNTVPGASVDSHGCPMDTDGDGVSDYLDCQLITPTECQPSDQNGVGRCPCPCNVNESKAICSFSIGQYFIYFSNESVELTLESKKILNRLAAKLKANPSFKVVVQGFDQMNTSYSGQQRSWDHVYTTIEYLVFETGIDHERFIFKYGQSQNGHLVILRSPHPAEEGASIQAPPFHYFSLLPYVKTGNYQSHFKYWEQSN